jgi:hypothetical protein
MNGIHRNLFRALNLSLISLGVLLFLTIQSHAASFSLVKTIDLLPLVGDDGSIEVDIVGDELYVANWRQDRYYRIDPVTESVLGFFTLGSGIRIDNHGSEYNPATGRLLHARDDDAGGYPGFDAYFETDTAGVLLSGPYELFGADNSEDPEGLTVDPVTGRVWVSVLGVGGIIEINPTDGTVINRIEQNFVAMALGFNPISRTIFFADAGDEVIKEIGMDGTGLTTVFNPGVGAIFGMAFTPTGDLVLLDFAAVDYGIPLPSQLLLYDSSDDADNVFTTSIPIIQVPFDIKPGSCPNPINLKSKGIIPTAIVGTSSFDVTQVDPASLLLEGVSPLRWAYVDATSPFEPTAGKQDCNEDCEELCPDGSLDLVLNYDSQEIIATFADVEDGECLVLHITGNLKDEFGGTPIVGEDVALILKKGKN